MTRDPVCQRDVDEQKAWEQGLAREFAGHVFYFCCESCLEQFIRSPAVYAGNEPEFLNADWWKQGGYHN